ALRDRTTARLFFWWPNRVSISRRGESAWTWRKSRSGTGPARGALLARTAWAGRDAWRGETAFRIFGWLKVLDCDLLFLFFCLWFVLHVTCSFHLFVVCVVRVRPSTEGVIGQAGSARCRCQ